VKEKLTHFFSESGPLSKTLGDTFEERPQQLNMAIAISETLRLNNRAVIEAATGTGKTLSYLVPLLMSKKKGLISTATKNLQEQIDKKDLPFLRKMGFQFKSVTLKGRNNYLCIHRWRDFSQDPLYRSEKESLFHQELLDWSETTRTGDRAELLSLPASFPTWQDISATSETCLGTECADYETCFVTQLRRQALSADLVIVNHHLFFADLALRAGGFGEVLPKPDIVVFDEAHHLEETATHFFGRAISLLRFWALKADLIKALPQNTDSSHALLTEVAGLDGYVQELFERLAFHITRGERIPVPLHLVKNPDISTLYKNTSESLTRLSKAIGSGGRLGEIGTNLESRCLDLLSDLSFILHQPEAGWVYYASWAGKGGSILTLKAAPVDLSEIFQNLLFPQHKTTVFTSATLAVNNDFHYFRSRISLSENEPVEECLLDPVFNYMNQALLYVPENLPSPNSPDFIERILPEITSLIELTEGRAFVLFTSYKNLHACQKLLQGRLRFPLLVQGEGSREGILNRFRSEPSVLLGTSSFWEGVDVPGELLSLVIMDRLPFDSPGDPIVSARLNFIREQGGNPFHHFQLPRAALTLKQGFGRLIRRKTDRGIVAIMDRRLLENKYGKTLLNTLPRSRRSRDFEIVTRWWKNALEH
jgi:ATP-dependent DNA helicase DinG